MDPPSPTETPRACLICLDNYLLPISCPGKVIDLIDRPITLGRSSRNQVVIRHPDMRSRHARIFPANGQWWIEAVGQRTEVLIFDRQIRREVLRNGDIIQFGNSLALRFFLGSGVGLRWVRPPRTDPLANALITNGPPWSGSFHTGFALGLLRHFSPKHCCQNLCFAPAMIQQGLMTLLLTASGTTRAELAAMLGLPNTDLEGIRQFNHDYRSAMAELNPAIRLRVANGLAMPTTWRIGDALLAQLSAEVMPIQRLPLTGNREENLVTLTRHLGEYQGMAEAFGWAITTAIDMNTGLHVINASRLGATWALPFDPANTAENVFYPAPGEQLACPMMFLLGQPLYYHATGDFQALRLPLGNGSASFYLYMPARGYDLGEFVAKLSPDRLDRWLSRLFPEENLTPDYVTLAMPRLHDQYATSLGKILNSMGIESAFAAEEAEFAGIDGGGSKVFLGDFHHLAAIDLDETGWNSGEEPWTMTVRGHCPTPEKVTMIVNRPYFWLVRDDISGLILFLGVVQRPAPARSITRWQALELEQLWRFRYLP